MSTNSHRTGGLSHNPLLQRTEPIEVTTPQQAGIPADTPAGTPADPQARVPASLPAVAPVSPSTRRMKFTFYFPEDQLDRLDQTWSQLRQRTRGTKRHISKSQFVSAALERLLEEYDRTPDAVIEDLVARPPLAEQPAA